MNKEVIIELLEDGAHLDVETSQFFHESFRKGFRKLLSSDVSFLAAKRVLGERLVYEDGIYSLKQA